jgi:cation diffusion facilitator CzcD-associated flavoprotein CzcO
MMERFDVVIVGAGLSGIGAARYLKTRLPDKSFVILETKPRMGGTWDLFRYPGTRRSRRSGWAILALPSPSTSTATCCPACRPKPLIALTSR